ncbi:MAG: hypothetical protein ACI8RZ_000528 [Myxococcota bacterium]|jgi:hypothetical protein
MLRSIRLTLLLAIVVSLGFAVSIEMALGDRQWNVEATAPPRAESGRGLYLLIIDSLAQRNLEEMPALKGMAESGFAAVVEPCADRFTTACVRELMTGRPLFSLVSVLENFNVIAPRPGPSLISDAQHAGLTVGFVSSGDLKIWRRIADADKQNHKAFGVTPHLRLGLNAAASHDVVVHHWVWHDVASHQSGKGAAHYARSLRRANALVAGLLEGLPEGMDLLVTGDHGHTPDGRHVQGLDVPTLLIAASPNLEPHHPEARIPITAVRFVSGIITGLYSPAAQQESDWLRWRRVGGPDVGQPLASVRGDIGPGPLLAAALMGVLMVLIARSGGALAWGWGVLMGLSYIFMLEWAHQSLSWWQDQSIPMLMLMGTAVLIGWRHSITAAWRGAVIVSAVLLVSLWPGLTRFGILYNITVLLLPGLLGVAVVALWQPQHRRALRWAIGFIAVLSVVMVGATLFDTNDFRIRSYPLFQGWPAKRPVLAALVAGGLGGLAGRLVDARRGVILAAAVLAGISAWIPESIQGLLFVALVGTLVVGRAQWRPVAITLLALAVSGHLYRPRHQLGVLLTVALIGSAIRIIGHITDHIGGEVAADARRWSVAVLLGVGAWMGLAWTTGLRASGIDFSFALVWMDGRWHERLWWMIALATLLKLFLPLVLFIEAARRTMPLAPATTLMIRLAVLRMGVLMTCASFWLVQAGQSAASDRLRLVLQDGFGWLLVAVVVYVLVNLPLRFPQKPTSR